MVERAGLMSDIQTRLPSFKKPPVVEVVLSLQFNTLDKLRVAQMGLLFAEFAKELPRSEEQGTLPPVYERFTPEAPPMPRVRIDTFDTPPLPRLWLLSDDSTELVQLQQDRFISNWRRADGAAATCLYPHFPWVFESFKKRLGVFQGFLSREGLGEITPNQCEVTYINHIESAGDPETRPDPSGILAVWKTRYSDQFLGQPEDVALKIRYVIPGADGRPAGRLHVSVQPAVRLSDRRPIYIMELTARGAPLSPDLEGAYRFFGLGHEWIVRGFTSITTQEMHQVWEREDV